MQDMTGLARRAAEHAYDQRPDDQRGVLEWHGLAAIFGNDGYRKSERAQHEVAILRRRIRDAGIEEVAFGLDERDRCDGRSIPPIDRGYTWAMLVRSTDLDAAHRMVCESWRTATGSKSTEALFRLSRKARGLAGVAAVAGV